MIQNIEMLASVAVCVCVDNAIQQLFSSLRDVVGVAHWVRYHYIVQQIEGMQCRHEDELQSRNMLYSVSLVDYF